MRFLLILLALASPLLAEVPKIRLLHVDDTIATIRVATDASPEKLTTFLNTLTTAGVTTFILESHNQTALQKQQPAWLEAGLTDITLRKPATRVISDFPLLEPLEAIATLHGIDEQTARELETFKTARKTLVTFLYQNGTPPKHPHLTHENTLSKIASLKSQLENLTTATPEKALQIAAQIDLPHNPVALSLEDHREALVDQQKLLATGIGHQHPDIKAVNKRLAAAKTLALKELSTIEESLHVRLYLLERNIIWFQKCETLPAEKKAELENQHHQKKSAYRTSLDKLRQMESAKDAALRTVPLPE